jgi:tetratricopeptide (TPR) repeat protein
LYFIGKSLSGLDEELDAARTFREALKIDPEDPEIYFALGRSYYKLNKNKKVKETLDILNMLDRTMYNQLRSEISGR